jgi:hypothetical protein
MSTTGQEEGLDADEMRRRAATYRAFLAIEVSETVLRLTYRVSFPFLPSSNIRESQFDLVKSHLQSEEDDHSLIPNVYNVICRTPKIEFSSKTTSFAELVNDVKTRSFPLFLVKR